MKVNLSGSKQHAELSSLRPPPSRRAHMLHPDMFSGHLKEHEPLIPSLLNSIRMRTLKQHSTQIHYEKDYDTLYDPDPSRKLTMLRRARLRRKSFVLDSPNKKTPDPSLFMTWSEKKETKKRADSLSLRGLKHARVDFSDFLIEKVANAFENEKMNTSFASADLKGILGEVNRVLTSVTNAAGKITLREKSKSRVSDRYHSSKPNIQRKDRSRRKSNYVFGEHITEL